ncbi:hypothetical protein WJX72_009214 [[Myrmecia] bisecta]|uniref:Uncharacterized protein n=1 Tax=[Myrmecia] bisecta TaxID=41462 RepID=A0AAW1PUB0_9CHLO
MGLLPSLNLLVTGGQDRMVRLWNLDAGTLLSTSKPCGGTVRALAMDADMLVSAGPQSGSIKLWRAEDAVGCAAHFDLAAPIRLAGCHTGPITSLALTDSSFYSASWDYCVRVWERQTLECSSVLRFDDWVWGVSRRGPNLLIAAGSNCAYVHDAATHKQLRALQNVHNIPYPRHLRLEGTRDGRLMFTGASDGCLLAHDLRTSSSKPAATLWQQQGAFTDLAFEDPCLSAALDTGAVLLLNVEAAMRKGNDLRAVKDASAGGIPLKRQMPSLGLPGMCIEMADQWLACGGENDTVRTWEFSIPVPHQRAQRTKAPRRNRARHAAAHSDAALPEASDAGPYHSLGQRGQHSTADGWSGGAADLEHEGDELDQAAELTDEDRCLLAHHSDSQDLTIDSDQLEWSGDGHPDDDMQEDREEPSSHFHDSRHSVTDVHQQWAEDEGAKPSKRSNRHASKQAHKQKAASRMGGEAGSAGRPRMSRGGGVIGPRAQVVVPSPVAHGLASADTGRVSPSMHAWQIVRPRPVVVAASQDTED